MAVSPLGQEQTDGYEKMSSALDTAKAAVPALSGVATALTGHPDLGSIAADRSLKIPRHILINSAIQDARRNQEDLEREFQARKDMPGIEEEIEKSHKWSQEANARIEALMGRLEEESPERDTQTHLTQGESIAMAMALAFGAKPGQVVSGTRANADKRAEIGFDNAVRRFDQRQRNTGTRMQMAIADKEHAQRWGEMLKVRDMDRDDDANRMRFQAGMQQNAQEFGARMQQIGLQIEEERREEDRQYEAERDRFAAAQKLALHLLEQRDAQKAEQVKNLLASIDEHRHDPESEVNDIDAVVGELKALGYNASPGQIALWKGRAVRNFKRDEVDRVRQDNLAAVQRAQMGDRAQGLRLDEFRAGAVRQPDGSYLPVTPQFNGGGWQGWDTPRPDAGKGESDYKSLEGSFEKIEGLRTEIDVMRDAGMTDDDLDLKLKIEEEKRLAGTIGDKRKASFGQASPEFKDWVLNLYQEMLNDIKNIKFDAEGVVNALAHAGAPKDRKSVEGEIRAKFRKATKFSHDDPAIKKAYAERNGQAATSGAGPRIKPGPIGGR